MINVKKYTNKKALLGLLAVVLGICVIFATSIVPLTIDPSTWGTTKFISNEIIQVALVMCGELSMILTAQAINNADEKSKIAKARVDFEESMKINVGDKVVAFTQWVRLVMQPKDLEDRYFRLLQSVGIENHDYLNLERNKLKELLEHAIKDGDKYYRQLNKTQYKQIMKILDGKEVIEFVSPETYLKISSIDVDKNGSEKMANQQKKTSAIMVSSIVQKTLMVIGVGLIFGGLVLANEERSTGEVISTLFSRLLTFGSSCFIGYYVGCDINDVNADYIKERILTHIKFASDKEFKPLSEDELAKKEFADYVKKENIKAIGMGEEYGRK